jgi:hypothetical protein
MIFFLDTDRQMIENELLMHLILVVRDDNSGTGMIFYPRVALVPDPNRDGYFFPPAGNLTGTRYFTTAIILGCEQVKMCSFCYINYDLF